jgi:hypothetical protein
MSNDMLIGIGIGIVIGWIFKFPFLLKWYKELKETRDYQEMKRKKHIEEIEEFIRKKKDFTENSIANIDNQ